MLREGSQVKRALDASSSGSIPSIITTTSNREEDKTRTSQRPQPTLLRFGIPLLVTEEVELEDVFQRKREGIERRSTKNRDKRSRIGMKPGCETPVPIQNSCFHQEEHLTTRQILAKVHSPRNYEYRGEKMRQTISDSCTTRVDVVELEAELNKRLKEFGTAEVGLCRRRIDLFSQCFDEIIRQVSMNCTDRGDLLLGIRDEINRTFASYESLFYSAIAYGLRKQLKCQENIETWQKKIDEINDDMYAIIEIYNSFDPAYKHFQEIFAKQEEENLQNFEAENERMLKNNEILKNLLTNSVMQLPSDDDNREMI